MFPCFCFIVELHVLSSTVLYWVSVRVCNCDAWQTSSEKEPVCSEWWCEGDEHIVLSECDRWAAIKSQPLSALETERAGERGADTHMESCWQQSCIQQDVRTPFLSLPLFKVHFSHSVGLDSSFHWWLFTMLGLYGWYCFYVFTDCFSPCFAGSPTLFPASNWEV